MRPDEVAPAYATSARDVEFDMPTVEASAERDRFLDKLGTLRAGTAPR